MLSSVRYLTPVPDASGSVHCFLDFEGSIKIVYPIKIPKKISIQGINKEFFCLFFFNNFMGKPPYIINFN